MPTLKLKPAKNTLPFYSPDQSLNLSDEGKIYLLQEAYDYIISKNVKEQFKIKIDMKIVDIEKAKMR